MRLLKISPSENIGGMAKSHRPPKHKQSLKKRLGIRLSFKEGLLLTIGTALALGSFKTGDPWVVVPMLSIAAIAFVIICVIHPGRRLYRSVFGAAVLLVLSFIGWRDLRPHRSERVPLASESEVSAEGQPNNKGPQTTLPVAANPALPFRKQDATRSAVKTKTRPSKEERTREFMELLDEYQIAHCPSATYKEALDWLNQQLEDRHKGYRIASFNASKLCAPTGGVMRFENADDVTINGAKLQSPVGSVGISMQNVKNPTITNTQVMIGGKNNTQVLLPEKGKSEGDGKGPATPQQ